MNNQGLSQNDLVQIMDILKQDENIYALVAKSLGRVAEKLSIHSVSITCVIDGKEEVIPVINYHQGINEENCNVYRNEFTSNGVKTTFNIYRYKATGQWNNDQLDSLRVVTTILYMNIEKSKLIEFIERAKNIDHQTGIPNYNGFDKYLNKIVSDKKGSEYAAAYFNIKNFKIVNSQYGNNIATQILVEYTRKMYEETKEHGIVGRLGGDNYMAVIKKDKLDEFINRLNCTRVSFEFKGKKIECELQARAGIYLLTGNEQYYQQAIGKISNTFGLCRRMDSTNIIFYDENIEKQLIREKEIEREIEPAIKNKEFYVVYQPKVNLQNYEIVGAEALIRWKHNGEILPPFHFIPICERTNLICKLDFYVLESVCESIRMWCDQGIKPVKVSVNFSKKHFAAKDTAKNIMDIIRKYNVSPELVEIEFTETAYLDEYENLIATLKDLKEYGLGTSMDDFGVGYSSINLLQDLEFDVLKLDRAFLLKQSNERNKIICENIVKMSKELEMDIISEGVETTEHVEFLKSIGCNKAQGYFFDKPLEIEEFKLRLLNRKY